MAETKLTIFMICILDNLSQDKSYFNSFRPSSVKTDALIISSHRSQPERDDNSLKKVQKLHKEKHLRTKTNFKQSLGKFGAIVQAGNSGRETIAAGSHLAFASHLKRWHFWKHRESMQGRYRQSTACERRTLRCGSGAGKGDQMPDTSRSRVLLQPPLGRKGLPPHSWI